MRISERGFVSFLKKHQLILISFSLALFSLHLALTDKKEVARGVLIKEIISYTVVPVQSVMVSARDTVAGTWSGYINLVSVKDENDTLKDRVEALQHENNKLKEDLSLNSRLKQLLDYKEKEGFKTEAAAIVGFNMDLWTRTVTINKGRDSGILKDLAVITPGGVLGRIMEVNGKTSRVLLSTDTRSNIDVLVQRSRVKGVVEGNGSDGLKMKYIRQVDDVQVGDTLITSGLSGIFPKGLIVGEVTKIEKSSDNFFKYVEVRPKVDPQTLEEVLVVKDTGFTAEEF